MDIRNDYKNGLSYTEIGKKHNVDWRTAKKYAYSDQKPKYELTDPKPSKLDPYKHQIDLWLEKAPYSAAQILEKLEELGCDCKYTIVSRMAILILFRIRQITAAETLKSNPETVKKRMMIRNNSQSCRDENRQLLIC